MNYRIKLAALAYGILALATTSCENAEYKSIENLVYISEAASASTGSVTIEDSEVTTSLTVRLAKAIDTDVTVNLAIDESALSSYNSKNETDYKVVDAANLDMPSSVVIPAGSVSADPVSITIHPFDSNGAQYAIPVSITSVEGAVGKTENSSKYIFLLEQPLAQEVPTFTYQNQMKLAPTDEDWGITLNNYTFEWWVKMSGFSVNNQAIFNFSADHELYIRFGDLVYASGGSYVYNFLQIKTMGSQFDTGDPTAGYGLTADTWYHFAISYDASTGTSIMYQNGTQVSTLTTAAESMTINGVSVVCSGASYFWDKCELCQVRLWKTTRSAAQISANMRKEVDPTNSDLVFYLPMNEGSGTTLHDTTGNGHDAEIGNDGSSSSVTWNSYSFSE